MKRLVKTSAIAVVASIIYAFLCKIPEWMLATESTKDVVILTGILPLLNAIAVIIGVFLTLVMALCIGILGFKELKESKEPTASIKNLIILTVISLVTIWSVRIVFDNSNYVVWSYFKTLSGSYGVVVPYAIRGIWLYLIYLVEGMMIIIGSIIIFKLKISESFFCEKCHVWTDATIEENLALSEVGNIEALLEDIRKGEFSQLCDLEVEETPGEKSNFSIKIVFCKSCSTALLSVSYNQVTPTKEKEKFEVVETKLINKAPCPAKLFNKYYCK